MAKVETAGRIRSMAHSLGSALRPAIGAKVESGEKSSSPLLASASDAAVTIAGVVNRLYKHLAISIPILIGLSGCLADAAFLVRDQPRFVMTTPPSHGAETAPAKTTRPSFSSSSAITAETNSTNAGNVENKRYFVAIGRVVLRNHVGSDDWSSPDIYVKVRRRDLEVTEMIRRTKDMLSVLGDRKTAVEKELELLRIKKQNSELVPGEPLSSNQLERMAELFRNVGFSCDGLWRSGTCSMCAPYDERVICSKCEDCKELHFLSKKKEASELVPGPALDSEEQHRMRQLQETRENISMEMSDTNRAIRQLRNRIIGKTHTVTTPGLIIDYGFRSVLEVFLNDEVWVSVYDADIFQDDLYGSTTFHVRESMLKGDDVELSAPNVSSIVVRLISR